MKTHKLPPMEGQYLVTVPAETDEGGQKDFPGYRMRLVTVDKSRDTRTKDLVCGGSSVRARMFKGCTWIGPLNKSD